MARKLTSNDIKNIKKLQKLRNTRKYNIYNKELYIGLIEIYGEKQGDEILIWIKNNNKYYLSGEWTTLILD